MCPLNQGGSASYGEGLVKPPCLAVAQKSSGVVQSGFDLKASGSAKLSAEEFGLDGCPGRHRGAVAVWGS